MSKVCKECLFVGTEEKETEGRAFNAVASDDEKLTCQRYAPRVVGGQSSSWRKFPIVAWNDWCGEYSGEEYK